MDALDHAVATATLGLDTLWGGDVLNPSGTGRFIADSWFSDEPRDRFPDPRRSGGVWQQALAALRPRRGKGKP